MNTAFKVISVMLCLSCFATGCANLHSTTGDRTYDGRANKAADGESGTTVDAWAGALIDDEEC